MQFVRRLATVASALRAGRQLQRHDGWSRADLERHQRSELVTLLKHAARHSLFYAERLRGPNHAEDTAPAVLAALPVLDKTTMLANLDRVFTDRRLTRAGLTHYLDAARSDDLYLDEYRVLCSGGTSGERGVFVFGRTDWVRVLGGLVRWNAGFLGISPRLPRRRVAVVAATTPLHMTARMGSSIDVGAHAMLRLDARTTLESLVTQLNAFKPDTLIAYPSSAALLAEEQLAGRLRITPRVVCTTSEVRTDDMEVRIVAAWRQRPYNCYASSETGILAVDCDLHRGLHVLTDHTLVEVVDADDRAVPDGTQGHHLLVTSLLNRIQPIVRYRLDDLVTISPEPCPCGRPFPLIIGLDGRSDDLLRMPAGNGGTVVVHPLALRSPLAGIAALRQYRMIHECGRLRVEIVAREPGVATEVERRLRTALSAQHVVDVPIDVLEVASIARHAATGKFKLIEAR